MQPGRVYRQVPNFNFVPLEYQKSVIPERRSLLRILLIIVIVVEVIFIQNLYGKKSDLEADADVAQRKIEQIAQDLIAVDAREEEAKELQATIERLRQQRLDLDNVRELGKNQADWPRVMAALFQSQPPGLVLSSVNLAGTQIDATGTAPDYSALFEYHGMLLDSPAISQVRSLTSEQGESSVSFSLVATINVEEE